MKILRFNESEKRYPKKVSQDEFFERKTSNRMIDFTQSERTMMRDILTEKRKRRDINWTNSLEFIEIYCGREFFEIVKLDDAWFTIINEDIFGITKYYVCDEFEEVVNFLTDFV
jgi:hypothetical protein